MLESDGIHFVAATNRRRGDEAGEAMLRLLYPGTTG